jgi:uncharacterized membrane protein YiaA
MPGSAVCGLPERTGGSTSDRHRAQEGTMDATTAYRRRWATLAILTICLLVIGLDNTILNLALPSLATSLNADDSQLQ